MEHILNFNVGVLGHVDSGKTSLAKALSTIASTAAFDKNPQSQDRGITIDLGFSSFCVNAPKNVEQHGFKTLQITLVDCPGHASLIRTIIGGAKIIDAMLLIIDITKGMQTQTAECLIIGEILCKEMVVVLNKIDLISKEKQDATIEKVSKKLRNTLKNTKFSGSKIVAVAANPSKENFAEPVGLEGLISAIKDFSYLPDRQVNSPFTFSVDHCFGIRGQGTIITGTVLQGSVAVNDNIEIPILKLSKKVKSMQMFRQPVEKAIQGDRIGICVTQFDPKLLERSLIGASGSIQMAHGFISEVSKINYYKQGIASKAKFHISLGHDTVLSKVTFFGSEKDLSTDSFDFDKEYRAQEQLLINNSNEATDSTQIQPKHQYAFIEFERVIPLIVNSIFIASKLDMDVHTSMCRLAFWGKVSFILSGDYKKDVLSRLKVYKDKFRDGTVERMNNDSELIVRNLLKKGTDISLFCGLKLDLSTGEKAVIDGNFGQSGKVKIRLLTDLQPSTKALLTVMNDNRKKGKKSQETKLDNSSGLEVINVHLKFKKYIFDTKKKIVQT